MRDGKDTFYRQLRIDKKTRDVIKAYRKLKKEFEKNGFINLRIEYIEDDRATD